MKLYLDCQTGVAGDMLISSLLGTGIPMNILTDYLQMLSIKDYELELREKPVSSINTINIKVNETKPQKLRHLKDLVSIITDSGLSSKLKKKIIDIFITIAEAEAKVHGKSVDHVHFHEVGAVDTIIDVVGACALIEHLSPDEIICSKINLGSGFVKFSHGTHPVPAPAVAEISKDMLVFSTDSGMEMATPTGLAVLKNIVDAYGPMPEANVKAVGYGSGTYSSDKHATYVRAFLLE